jgi:hypothetical protein
LASIRYRKTYTLTLAFSILETGPQGSNNRGKTTQKILPIVAVALAVGAFTWRFTSADKGKITEMGNTNRSKTQSKSAHEAIVNPDVPTPGQK